MNVNSYDIQGMGQQAWHEQRLAEYDVAALDFCDIVGTSNPAQTPPHVRRWFRNVFTEPIGQLDSCNVPEEIDQPYQPSQAACTPLPEAALASSSQLSKSTFPPVPGTVLQPAFATCLFLFTNIVAYMLT